MRSGVDRITVERYLSFQELVSIADWCDLLGIALDAWVEHPAALAWLDLAVARAADEAQQTGKARSRSAALRYVCGRCGLDAASVQRRWQKARAARRLARRIGGNLPHPVPTPRSRLSA